MIARTRRTLPITLAILASAASLAAVVLATKGGESGAWVFAFCLLAASFFYYWVAIWRPAQLTIERGRVVAGGFDFPLSELKDARVVRVFSTGGRLRLLWLQFSDKNTHGLSLKMWNLFQGAALPRFADDGTPLGGQARILIPLGPTDRSDAELNAALAAELGATGEPNMRKNRGKRLPRE